MLGQKFAIGIREFGDRQLTKSLEKKFGQQIGRVASDGSRTFSKEVRMQNPLEKDVLEIAEEITHVDKNGNIKSKVRKFGDEIKGLIIKEKRGPQGQIDEVARIRMASNHRHIESMNMKTGDIKIKETSINPLNNEVTTVTSNGRGNVDTITKHIEL